MKKIIYYMKNENIKYNGTTSLKDYKYIVQHSTNIKFKGKDVYCNYNGFQCKFIF